MPAQTDIPDTSPAEASQLAAGQALLDVRELEEWEAGHAPGALHLPLGQLRTDRLPSARTLFVICRSGNRSGKAVEALRRAGYDAVNVRGGMGAWQAEGLPVVRSDGSPGTVA